MVTHATRRAAVVEADEGHEIGEWRAGTILRAGQHSDPPVDAGPGS